MFVFSKYFSVFNWSIEQIKLIEQTAIRLPSRWSMVHNLQEKIASHELAVIAVFLIVCIIFE